MGRPKGSKNKPKHQHVKIHHSKGIRTDADEKPDTMCCICGRVLWGEWQGLGFGKYRHKYNCAPGTSAWCEYYSALPEAQKTEEGNMLYAHALQQNEVQG